MIRYIDEYRTVFGVEPPRQRRLGVATGDVVPGGVVWWGEPSDETVG